MLFGPDGAADALSPVCVFLMCSTVDPGWSARMEEKLEARGLLYLDAPISGGAARAAKGEITMMTAGRPEAYAKCGDVLKGMAANVYKLGDRAGAGSTVKIVNQLLAGVHIAAAAEAMALGIEAGVVRRRSSGSSRTARATAGCSRTACPTCSRATTRRSPRSTYS